MAPESPPAYKWAELAAEVVFVLIGILVYRVGWTDFGEIMIVVGIFGLVSWPVRVWRAKRRPADQPPVSN